MKSTDNFIFIVSEINNFAYYKASGGCARILQGNMPLSAAKIRRGKRQNEKSFAVYYNRSLVRGKHRIKKEKNNE